MSKKCLIDYDVLKQTIERHKYDSGTLHPQLGYALENPIDLGKHTLMPNKITGAIAREIVKPLSSNNRVAGDFYTDLLKAAPKHPALQDDC